MPHDIIDSRTQELAPEINNFLADSIRAHFAVGYFFLSGFWTIARRAYLARGEPLTPSQPPITGTTHTLPFDRLSPRGFERLCLWLVEREGYLRCRELTEDRIAIVEGWKH